MLFFYIRHGDPIYDPDSLTPLGQRQAEAAAKRLAMHGIDEIYASTSKRAQLTAQPTCELVQKPMTLVDFANENHAWNELVVDYEDGRRAWMFACPETRELLASREMYALGENWYEHPRLNHPRYKQGMERIRRETDAFFANLGYEHCREKGMYRVTAENDKRVALFAHQGFGLAFLSSLLDIPYPAFSVRFDMCHSGITVIDFRNDNGWAIPRVCQLSADSHLYREGLPTLYNGAIRI